MEGGSSPAVGESTESVVIQVDLSNQSARKEFRLLGQEQARKTYGRKETTASNAVWFSKVEVGDPRGTLCIETPEKLQEDGVGRADFPLA